MSAICLVTGFAHFGTNVVYEPNPSGEIAEELNGKSVGGCRIHGIVLPVEFPRASEMLVRLLEELDPALVVSMGLYSPGGSHVRVEVAAVNAYWDGSRLRKVVDDAPLGEPIRIPVDPVHVARVLNETGLRARPSASIGLYLCNVVAYLVYRWGWRKGRPSVFLHLPWSTRLEERLRERREGVPVWLLREGVERLIAALGAGKNGNTSA
ncbi:peptidase C15 pyroglutamyl peptidase I [Pyrolobus fumarii 1A]|uniref:Peptidase C15 pyroglutamyl peptidase I n=1 Tax=Pyrolobus fumarii (strain DSM 11204 / 1A) TaxID=694429 RepID=G0EGU9_PYRF1|nr:peptidase C15 [Pyrolobus fumarii]AEM39247.1 peptidase C15 pyroglutamyl peptidase I [Pyrolobus fumarii 1A]